MEPIRPDDDELRGKSPSNAKPPTVEAPKAPEPKAKPKAGDAGVKSTRSRSVWLLSLVILGVMVLGGFLWLEQERRITALEGQLEEADYWARQSKLALARFEGELSETGESLEETGASMAEQLDTHSQRLEGHSGRLDTADSEIRKLWVIANERNKQMLAEHRDQIAALQTSVDQQDESLAALTSDLESQRQKLTGQLEALAERLSGQGELISGRLDDLGEQVAGVDEVVDNRLQRFVQERRLADEEVQTRLQALERQVTQQAAASELGATQARLAELEQTVRAIDSSRSQLTSRLVRMSDEIASLRQQQSLAQ